MSFGCGILLVCCPALVFLQVCKEKRQKKAGERSIGLSWWHLVIAVTGSTGSQVVVRQGEAAAQGRRVLPVAFCLVAAPRYGLNGAAILLSAVGNKLQDMFQLSSNLQMRARRLWMPPPPTWHALSR